MSSSRRMGARFSQGDWHEARPHLLAARTRERAHCVRDAHALRPRRPHPQGSAIPGAETCGGHRSPPDPGDAGTRLSCRPRGGARTRYDREGQHRRALHPGSRLLPTGVDVDRDSRRRAHGAGVRLVLGAQAHREQELAAPSLGDLRDLRRGHRPRDRRRHGCLATLGVRAVRVCGRLRRSGNDLEGSDLTDPGSRPPPASEGR